ncbi:hypothetical protein [Aquihabitans sp. McL0605]|uniref:hypothetical protein n=1 Tax=Aquihabitans sp. McL0605 TaxID=3415671 RepID=UPI003CE7CE8E
MTDAPFTPDGSPEPAAGKAQEIEVDLAAFLPEGVELGDPGADADVDADADVIEELTVIDEVVVVDGVVVAEEITVVDEVIVVPAPAEAPPAVDLEALTQIERDLDAVDAAIAALDAGTYGIDPATGQPIDDALLAEDPTRVS